MKSVLMTHDIYLEIMNTIGVFPSEAGGMIACREDGVVCKYYFDKNAGTGKNFYKPTVEDVLRVVNDEWNINGFVFCGIVHSHPTSTVPSVPDVKAAVRIMRLNNMTKFIMPILTMKSMDVYLVELNVDSSYEVHPIDCEVVDLF